MIIDSDPQGSNRMQPYVQYRADAKGRRKPLDLLIYGSCVSRDMVEYVQPEGVQLRGYIARQSWRSINSPAQTKALPPADFDSPFLERTYLGDLEGNALKRISEAKRLFPDVQLLIDLTDERGGFFEGPDGGIVSNTPDSPAATVLTEGLPGWRRLRFGSLGHALEFTTAAEKLQRELTQIGVWQNTTILANEWAETFPDGATTPPSYGMSASDANAEYAEYYELLSATGWNVVAPDVEKPTGDPDHKWGQAPFHYTNAYYLSLWNAFLKA